jgi:hypothetical protein
MRDRSQYFAISEEWPQAILEDWRWLIGPTAYKVHRVTAMGSLFLLDPAGTIFFLDTTGAWIKPVAAAPDQLDALFESTENRHLLLWAFFVRELQKQKIELKSGQCYGWKIPPVLGGEPIYANVEPTDVAVHVSLQGQVHEQARHLAPGTRIDEVRIVEPAQPWWRKLLKQNRAPHD